jgi:hypothetical protein
LRVVVNRRSIFGSKREKVPGVGRRLHTEELHNLYTSPNITEITSSVELKNAWRYTSVPQHAMLKHGDNFTVTLIKFKRMRFAGHVSRMGEMRNV